MDSFWQTIPKPLIGLAPMDGITDSPFRRIVDEIGHPSLLYTEFISADGFIREIPTLRRTLLTHQTKTPLVVQFFTADEKALYEAIKIVAAFPIQGVDINMGCPNRHIVYKSGGASLIKKPLLAKRLIRIAKQAVKESEVELPISVKTRIGYEAIDTSNWINTLLEEEPAAIALHGRTVSQMYQGLANWEELGKAAELAKSTKTLLLGNGDVHSWQEAQEKIKTYTPDGILIGRASLGNPWVFQKDQPTLLIRLQTAKKHIMYYRKFFPTGSILPLRKHISSYLRGFPDASTTRTKLMEIIDYDDLLIFIDTLITNGIHVDNALKRNVK